MDDQARKHRLAHQKVTSQSRSKQRHCNLSARWMLVVGLAFLQVQVVQGQQPFQDPGGYPSSHRGGFHRVATVPSQAESRPVMRPVPRSAEVERQHHRAAAAASQSAALKWKRSASVRQDDASRSIAGGTVELASHSVPGPENVADQKMVNDRQLSRAATAPDLATPSSGLPSHRLRLSRDGRGRQTNVIQTQATDYFSNPFGDDSTLGRSTGSTADRSVSPPVIRPQLPILAKPQDNSFVPPQPLRQNGEDDSIGSLFDSFDLPPRDAKPPQSAEPAPNDFDPPSSSDRDSIRDLLENNEPEKVAPAELPRNQPSDPPSPDTKPEPLSQPEPSLFDDNPFGGQADQQDNPRPDIDPLDRQDRDQLNEGSGRRGGLDFDDLRPQRLTNRTISCEDFRTRIRNSSIDQVSLDISPPYRPDEIDVSKYEQLKARFDEKQQIRQWRTADGVPLAKGRLRDIAYEKVIIETEFGTQEKLPYNKLGEADLAYIAENWGIPQQCLLEQVAQVPRNWAPTTFTWHASNLCHNPLYFEDVNLERYGHTHGPVLEPVIQTAHFFGNIAVLPYKMGVHAPSECQYSLGYYRPGNCAPWIKPPVPISLKGGLNQAATMTGLFFLVP